MLIKKPTNYSALEVSDIEYSDGGGLKPGEIAGIVIGCVAAAGIIGAGIYFGCRGGGLRLISPIRE